MEILQQLLDFILHVDMHLRSFVEAYGAWVYALLFLIIFVETGVVVMPFLPGDSLLFVVGALCGAGLMNLPLVIVLLIAAAILGNQSNYAIGRHFGPRVFQWENSRFFNKAAFDQAHAFYEKYGGVTIVAARFMPFLRTFAPFVAGVAHMTRRRFTMYDVIGGVLWVGGVTLAGYLEQHGYDPRSLRSVLKEGRIAINGIVVRRAERYVGPDDVVALDGDPV